MWQGGAPFEERASPLKPPSPELVEKADVKMPSSLFVADYQGPHPPRSLKALEQQGKVHLVSNFPQGFYGKGVEKYP